MGEQCGYLRLWWPEFRSRVSGGLLVSTGELQPSGLSGTYTVRVSQEGASTPEVRVLQPQLRRREQDEVIPHMYEQERLCLYLPGSGQWKPADPIAVKILPWASLWLYFYEVWHATGEWLGGGVHPDVPMSERETVYE